MTLIHLLAKEDAFLILQIGKRCAYLSKLQSKTGNNSYQKSYYDEGNSITEAVRYSCYKTAESHCDKAQNTLLPD
jgi:hypothetical protein